MCFKKRKPEPSTCGSQVYDPETTRQIIREHIKANIGEKRYNKLDCPPEISHTGIDVCLGALTHYWAKLSYHGKEKQIQYNKTFSGISDIEFMDETAEWMNQIDRNIAEVEAFFPFRYYEIVYGRGTWTNIVFAADYQYANPNTLKHEWGIANKGWLDDVATNTRVLIDLNDIYTVVEHTVETIDDIPFWSHRMEEFGKVRIPLRGATRLES